METIARSSEGWVHTRQNGVATSEVKQISVHCVGGTRGNRENLKAPANSLLAACKTKKKKKWSKQKENYTQKPPLSIAKLNLWGCQLPLPLRASLSWRPLLWHAAWIWPCDALPYCEAIWTLSPRVFFFFCSHQSQGWGSLPRPGVPHPELQKPLGSSPFCTTNGSEGWAWQAHTATPGQVTRPDLGWTREAVLSQRPVCCPCNKALVTLRQCKQGQHLVERAAFNCVCVCALSAGACSVELE